MKFTEIEALQTYAKMWNNLDAKPLEAILADDFIYESQKVLQPIESKQEFMDYIKAKLQIIASANVAVYAEMGTVAAYGRKQPCVVLAQNSKSDLVALALAKMEEGKLKRLDLCIIPSPESAERSGNYPQ